jgi:dethiobiotin synthetase
MSAYFVTSTGTDIGKTYVTAGLAKYWRTAGETIDAIKPVMTGYDPAEAEGSDSGIILKALGHAVAAETIERISPWRFATPLSPDVASRREGRSVPFEDLVAFSRHAIAQHSGKLLIEGVGGIMVPLDDRHTVLDWMMALNVPLVLVVGTYLGTLSHTLTCIDVLKRRELAIKALVVNETPGSSVSLSDTMSRLTCFAPSLSIVGLKHKPDPTAFKTIAELL